MQMTLPAAAAIISDTLDSDTLDRAKSYHGNTYCILLTLHGVAEYMAQKTLREVKVTFHLSGELVTLEARR
jgi:hypothetical protein